MSLFFNPLLGVKLVNMARYLIAMLLFSRRLPRQRHCALRAALNFVDTTDLYVLFGNLIDNCIEAVSKLPGEDVKNIQVTVRRDKGFVIVATENGYVGELHWSGKRLRTSKPDKSNHGFGMLSIEDIVHKYEGRYSINVEDHIFYMNIVFPVASDDASASVDLAPERGLVSIDTYPHDLIHPPMLRFG